jgi:DNA-binding XRE family transcriptional regulator
MKERSGHFMQHEYQNLLGNSETQILSNIKLVFDKWDNASVEDNIKCFKQYMGLKLRLRRKQLGLTQTKIAKKLNVTFQQFQKYEKATNSIPLSKLMLFCEATKTDMEWFIRPIRKMNKQIYLNGR